MEDTARPKCLNIFVVKVKWRTGNTSYPLYCFLYLKERHFILQVANILI